MFYVLTMPERIVFSMASNYNSRYRPAEVLIKNGKDYLIRQRETMEDLLKGQELVEF